MNMAGRFKCPACTDGFNWKHGYYDNDRHWSDDWKVEQCALCKGHRFVLTNEDGTIKGPDAPPRYMCDHGIPLAETATCEKCHPKPVPHAFTDEEIVKEVLYGT